MRKSICLAALLLLMLCVSAVAQDSTSVTNVSTVKVRGRSSVPSRSTTGNAVYYFDRSSGKLKVSQNGGAFADFVAAGGGGSVSSVSVVTASGVSGSVANPTTTPTITLSLAAITPTGITMTAPTANAVPVTLSGYSLTGSNASSLLDLSGTWNTSGTPTAIKFNLTDTASDAASLLFDLQIAGASKFKVAKTGDVTVAGSGTFTGTSLTGLRGQTGSGIVMPNDRSIVGTPAGLDLVADSANGRGLRVVVDTVITAQDLVIQGIQGTEDGYTVFSARDSLGLVFANPNGPIDFAPTNVRKVQLDGDGHFLFVVDNTNDIGASGATRPRTGYFGTSVVINGPVNLATFTPSGSADSSGNTGDVRWDASFIYVKTGAGAWKRAALSTF